MNCTYNLRPANPRYQNLVNRIVLRVGLKYSIQVYASDTPNACATLFKNCSIELSKPIIAYNPLFIRNVEYNSSWGVVAIFAHEVAHHYNKDFHRQYISNFLGASKISSSHKKELNADRFAGFILRYEGATLDQALEMYSVVDFTESDTHPSTSLRIKSMKEGWNEANNALLPKKKIRASYELENSLFLGLGALALIGIGAAVLSGSD